MSKNEYVGRGWVLGTFDVEKTYFRVRILSLCEHMVDAEFVPQYPFNREKKALERELYYASVSEPSDTTAYSLLSLTDWR